MQTVVRVMFDDEVYHILEMWEAFGEHDLIVSKTYVFNEGVVDLNALLRILEYRSKHRLKTHLFLRPLTSLLQFDSSTTK